EWVRRRESRRSDRHPRPEWSSDPTCPVVSGVPAVSIRLLASIVALCVTAAAGRTEDWPQFRGPAGTGGVTGKVLPPDTWTTTKNVAWKYEVPGHGWSCPIVVDGKVYVTSCVTDARMAAPKTGYYAPQTPRPTTANTAGRCSASTQPPARYSGRGSPTGGNPNPRSTGRRATPRKRPCPMANGCTRTSETSACTATTRLASNCGPARGT